MKLMEDLEATVKARASAPWSLRARCPWDTLIHAVSRAGSDGLLLRCRNESKNAIAISIARFLVDQGVDVTCILCVGMERK